jgi:hypothetical protein
MPSCMGKRLMVAVVGAGIGSLAGLLISFLGGGNLALIIGAAAGAVVPFGGTWAAWPIKLLLSWLRRDPPHIKE